MLENNLHFKNKIKWLDILEYHLPQIKLDKTSNFIR